MIEFWCPKCGLPIRVPDAAAGQSGQCKFCGTSQVVPTPMQQDEEFDPLVELTEASAVVPTSGNLPALVPDWYEYPVFAPPPPTFPPMVRPVAGEPPQQPTHVVTINVVRESGAAHSLGIASMVLGIVALVVIWIPLVGLMVAPLGALGLLLGVVGSFVACRRNGSGIGYSIAGGAISALALLIGFSVNYALYSAEKELRDQRENDSRAIVEKELRDQREKDSRAIVEKEMRDQREKERRRFEIVSTSRSDPGMLYKVKLLSSEAGGLTLGELSDISLKVSQDGNFTVFFFLPNKEITGKAWAVSKRRSRQRPDTHFP